MLPAAATGSEFSFSFPGSGGIKQELERTAIGVLDQPMLDKIFRYTSWADLTTFGSLTINGTEQQQDYFFVCHRRHVDDHLIDFYGKGAVPETVPVMTLHFKDRDQLAVMFPDETTLTHFVLSSRDLPPHAGEVEVQVDEEYLWAPPDGAWACQFCKAGNRLREGPLCTTCRMHPLSEKNSKGIKLRDPSPRARAVEKYTGDGIRVLAQNDEINGNLRRTIPLSDWHITYRETYFNLRRVLDPKKYKNENFGVSVPLYTGWVSRAQVEEYQTSDVGNTLSFPAFTSTSAGEEPPLHITSGTSGMTYVLRWISKTGHDLRMLSERSLIEQEILFDTGLRLKVIERKPSEDGSKTIITCEEIVAEADGGAVAAEGGGAGQAGQANSLKLKL